jgi:D-threo-aldose 1-dehydrogenase
MISAVPQQKRRSQLGLTTFPLGFGCVQLTAHSTEAEAVAILEHAFSLGITHFDVARAYGFGRAERILGKFLRGRREHVTVATKVGLQPPTGLAGNARLITAAKRLLGPFPALLQRAKRRGSMLGKSGLFGPQAVTQSVETSLRELGTDYIDLLLLHEATLADAASEALLEALEKLVAKGAVRHLGIASEFAKLQGNVAEMAGLYEVVQFNDDAQTRNLQKLAGRVERLCITHSVFAPVRLLREAVRANPEIARDGSQRVNANLSDPAVIAGLFLSCALRSNAEGVVLFSSKNPSHIEANVREAKASRFNDDQLTQFSAFVDRVLSAADQSGLRTNQEIA